MDTRITQFLGHVDTFTRRIANLDADCWESPSPCEGWTAKEVLDHVVDTQRDVFGKQGLELGPRPEGVPHEVWTAHAAAVRSAAADEETFLATYDSFFGPTTLADTLLSFYCFDLIIHAWDIHRAFGNDLDLTSAELDLLETCIRSWGEVLYREGICKPPVEVPGTADRQTRLLALTGRRR
ncbi:TIGR03086 family metal-binding protein [[Pseudopropionibacterium] massiliense]|uniref:TIGR03086 family metal-binding protein n=1 Tax=[Pseudopropionibacterium] massiliense TaxID=2220000 RepID=UPI0013EF0A5E|nr:TIGR03086 family metal-binding protein [[Pseudopropionibacterium] massiliense]